jgi:SlyX protein
MESRIVELEVRFMHQERLLEELSAVLLDQGRSLERLRAEVTALRARVASGPEEQAPDNERPPHY